jgi:hypothetical protein
VFPRHLNYDIRQLLILDRSRWVDEHEFPQWRIWR